MIKKFLVVLLLVLCFSIISSAQNPTIDLSKYTFSHITKVLNDKVYVEIREFIKSYDLFPYSDEKGTEYANHIADIIIKHEINKDFLLKQKPYVAIQFVSDPKVPQRVIFYLQITLQFIEFEQMKDGKPILGDLVIIKHIFLTYKDKTVKI